MVVEILQCRQAILGGETNGAAGSGGSNGAIVEGGRETAGGIAGGLRPVTGGQTPDAGAVADVRRGAAIGDLGQGCASGILEIGQVFGVHVSVSDEAEIHPTERVLVAKK